MLESNETPSPDQATPDIPPEAAQVARRSLVLAAVACRGFIESHPESDSLHNQVLEWLTQFDLWREVEPDEKKILYAPLGTLETKDALRASWDVEGVAVLAWALKQLPFPGHDQQVNPHNVTDAVWLLDENAEELIRTATLRNATELEACRELLYALHTRLRDFMRHRQKKDFSHWVEKTWIDALKLDAVPLIADNDLAIGGRPIGEVEYSRVLECEGITCARHRAAIWLLGEYPSYSQFPVDT